MPYIYPDAFEDDNDIELKIQNMLLDLGVTIIKETKLTEIWTDKSLVNDGKENKSQDDSYD